MEDWCFSFTLNVSRPRQITARPQKAVYSHMHIFYIIINRWGWVFFRIRHGYYSWQEFFFGHCSALGPSQN